MAFILVGVCDVQKPNQQQVMKKFAGVSGTHFPPFYCQGKGDFVSPNCENLQGFMTFDTGDVVGIGNHAESGNPFIKHVD